MCGTLLLFYGLLYYLACFHGVLSATQGESQDQLLDYLFSNYTPYVRPVCDVDQPVEVKIDLAIRQIIELDEPKQILYLNAWVRLSWDDCNLVWHPDNYSGIDNIVVPFNRAWSPDITLYDNGDSELEGAKDYLISIKNSGTCTYNYPTIIKVLCRINVLYFPFDTQVCPLKFGSWSYHDLEINVTNRDPDGDMSSFVENTEWDLLSLPLKRHSIKYGCCPETYPDVTFYVTMKRKPLFYVLNLLFPCLLITAVALLGFILPPDAGEKVSLEITVLLSLAVFLLVVSETLPATSDGFPYIGIYFAMAMLLVSLSTLLTVLVLNVHHKGNLNKPVPLWVRKIVLNFLGKLVRVQNERAIHPLERKPKRAGSGDRSLQHETYINGYQEYQNKDQTYHNGNGTVGGSRPHQVGKSFHNHSNHDSHGIVERPLGSEFTRRSSVTNNAPRQGVHCAPNRGSTPRDGAGEASLDNSLNLPMRNSYSGSQQNDPSLYILQEQLRMLQREEVRIDGKIKHDHLSSEWKRVACVLDRVFLFLFLFIMTISSLGILLQLST